MKYNIKNLALCALVGLSTVSCKDWLSVDMEDKIMESVLFSEYQGYRSALNGIYTGMNNVYSTYLSTGALDVMAQYYNVTENNTHSMRQYSGYKYTESSFDNVSYSIWSRMYELLANTNVIIEHCADPDAASLMSPRQLAIIRGEAYALRGFLHFDLLRLYGPVFSQNPTMECMPYQSSSAREIQPFLPANEVIELVIKDLKTAESLLKDYDPILTSGVGDTETVDNGVSSYDLSFRNLRLNYYAVEALLARAYMWKGDKTEAYMYAKNNIIDKITTEDLEVFPWVSRSAIDAEERPDYVFSSEVIFSIYNSKRVDDVYNVYFSRSLSKSSRLTFYGTNTTGDSKVQYFYDDPNDLRIKMWEVAEPTQSELQEAASNNTTAETTLVLNKFSDFSGTSSNLTSSSAVITYRYMIPLIRLSEIYLIAAEAATSPSEAIELINVIRSHRECSNLQENVDLDRAITYEMAREVIGEGQLFYFYKRRNALELISGTSADGTYEMVSDNYIFPLPKAENEKRGSLN